MTSVVKVFALVGALAVVGVLVLGAMTVSMMRNGLSARDQPSRIETTLAGAMRSLAAPTRAATLTNPVRSSPEVLGEARSHWADHCAVCHANDGSGDTQIGRNLYPPAPDMRLPATQNLKDGELYFIIENGIRLTGMPAWGQGREDSQDSWKLVAFIRHLPALTPEELAEMAKMNPVNPGELKEQEEEDAFLRGGDDARQAHPKTEHTH